MKDSQKVYLRGNSERGDEVIRTLENLGGNNSLSLDGTKNDAYYFINPEGKIDATSIIGGIACTFIKEFYKEIKLPRWKPKYKESYYRIDWKGSIVDDIWHDTEDERICYEFGNCFRTPEEARDASHKIEEMLNSRT